MSNRLLSSLFLRSRIQVGRAYLLQLLAASLLLLSNAVSGSPEMWFNLDDPNLCILWMVNNKNGNCVTFVIADRRVIDSDRIVEDIINPRSDVDVGMRFGPIGGEVGKTSADDVRKAMRKYYKEAGFFGQTDQPSGSGRWMHIPELDIRSNPAGTGIKVHSGRGAYLFRVPKPAFLDGLVYMAGVGGGGIRTAPLRFGVLPLNQLANMGIPGATVFRPAVLPTQTLPPLARHIQLPQFPVSPFAALPQGAIDDSSVGSFSLGSMGAGDFQPPGALGGCPLDQILMLEGADCQANDQGLQEAIRRSMKDESGDFWDQKPSAKRKR